MGYDLPYDRGQRLQCLEIPWFTVVGFAEKVEVEYRISLVLRSGMLVESLESFFEGNFLRFYS